MPSQDLVPGAPDRRLESLRRSGLLDSPAEPSFDRLTRLAARLLGAPIALVSLVDGERQFFKSAYGLAEPLASERQMPISHSLCRHVVDSGEPLVVEDAREHPRLRENPAVEENEFVAYAGIPLRDEGGEIFGSFCAIDRRPRRWSEGDVEVLRELAGFAEAEIRLRAAEERARRTSERMRAVARVASDVLGARSLEALDAVLREACARVIPHDVFTFATYDEERHELRFLSGWDGAVYAKGEVVPLAGMPSERVVRQRHSLLTRSSDEPEGRGARRFGTERRSESVIRTPILSGQRVLGVISVQSYSRGIYGLEEVEALEALAAVVASAMTHLELLEEREASHEALRESEERFREVAETIPQVFFVFDPDFTRALYVSPAYERIWGLPLESIYADSRSFLGSVHPDDLPDLLGAMAQVKHGRVDEVRYRIRRPDGEERWLASQGFPVLDAEGRAVRVVGITEDVTEREHAAAALRESELRFRQMAENLRDVFWITDVAMAEILYVGPAYEQVWGRSREELYARPESWLECIHPEDRARVATATVDGGSDGFDIEYRLLRDDGEIRWIHDRGFPVRNEAGEVYRVAGIAEDVTGAKEAEAALRSTEERYRALVQATSETFWRADPGGAGLLEDSSWCDFTGQTPEEKAGWGWLDAIHPEDREPVREAWQAAVEEGATFEHEHRLRRHDGKYRRMMVRAVPVMEPDGSIREWVGAHSDVTTARELEEQLRQAQKMEAVGQLAGGIAHDFNNLLMVILGNIQLLLPDLPQDDRVREGIAEVQHAAKRAAALTTQLLAFSRKQTLQPRVVDLNGLVHETERLLQRLIPERISIRTALDTGAGQVHVDPNQLQQVLINLVTNARDAIAGAGEIVISTAARRLSGASTDRPWYVPAGEYAAIHVRDTGCGMDAATLARVFEPFFTTKEHGKGTGLGLSTVYGIIKQSGGFIWAESTPGSGTTFTVLLPPAEQPEERPMESAAPATPQSGEGTILVVEDQEEVRRVARRVLEHSGFTVLEAVDGEDALRVFDAHPGIDLVLSDVVMPRMDGPALARVLRERADPPRIVFMSGYAGEDFPAEIIDSSTPLLQKPVSPHVLIRAVREALLAPGPRTSGEAGEQAG